jgi:hypothetical protein
MNPFKNMNLDEVSELVEQPNGDVRRRYNTQKLIHYWLKVKGVTYNLKTHNLMVQGQDDEGVALDSLTHHIRLDAHSERVTLVRDLIEPSLILWIEAQTEEHKRKQKLLLTFNPSIKDDPFINLLNVLCGVSQSDKRRELDIAVMKHFVWQVKRKFWGLPSAYHMMPVFVGKQGGGKTRAIERFLKPVEDLYRYVSDMGIFNDERQLGLLSSSYILFADEMGRASEVQLGILKNMIGEGLVTQRIMRSTQHKAFKNRVTFIGASNEMVSEVVHDSTGMRRFWQLDCPVKLDWDLVNSSDFTQVWQSIDEMNPESPIVPYWNEVVKIQADTLKPPDTVEFYLIECQGGLKLAANEAEGRWVSVSEVYSSYADFTRSTGQKPFGVTKFSRRLIELGATRKRNNGTFFLLRAPFTSSDIS